MPAERRRSSRREEFYDDYASMSSPGTEKGDFSFAPNVTATTFESSRPVSTPDNFTASDTDIFEFEEDPLEPRRTNHGRKKPANHIPRPPNAFILFRSSFIKGRHVSTGVETNHSTLSKIIGLTWQNLQEEERQKWHARAKIAQDEHRRRFPQYTFRPIHNKSRGKVLEKKKPREVGPKDHKRCAKIAELLVCGKKGQELEEAIQEFDKYHVPEIVTRFEEPITASAFSSDTSKAESNSVFISSRKSSASSSRRSSCRASVSSCGSSPSPRLRMPSLVSEAMDTPPVTPFEGPSFMPLPDVAPPFDFESVSFPVGHPARGNDFTQDVSSTIASFDPVPNQDPSRLSVNTCYPNMEEWTRRSSPISSSTSSMPSTPAQMSMHFTEPYNTFSPETQSAYVPVPLDGTYCDYSKYSYAPISDQTCGVNKMENAPPVYPLFCPDITDAPMMRQDHDFSSLMESLTSYSL